MAIQKPDVTQVSRFTESILEPARRRSIFLSSVTVLRRKK